MYMFQAVNRPVLRLQTLMRILRGIDSTKGVLLDELASALAQGPWHQRPQHMHDDSYKVRAAYVSTQKHSISFANKASCVSNHGVRIELSHMCWLHSLYSYCTFGVVTCTDICQVLTWRHRC